MINSEHALNSILNEALGVIYCQCPEANFWTEWTTLFILWLLKLKVWKKLFQWKSHYSLQNNVLKAKISSMPIILFKLVLSNEEFERECHYPFEIDAFKAGIWLCVSQFRKSNINKGLSYTLGPTYKNISMMKKVPQRLFSLPKNISWNYIFSNKNLHINGLVQDCSNSIAYTLELLQSCTKPLI